ncbi:PREDICTED: uncharacterized protein LOC109233797 [Nicotiana attenuata]|uniref:uncharacterized protein LOC109233797 n=1 Tax=Nicotiana attenuata TaxID=49451 RepID=UPI000905C3A6|nr:PREDICTED: uncharacterized protein LOC109233797 [Nicotiana attenuata]
MLPPSPNYKLNIDGSYDPLTHKGGIGGVIRNHQGHWIFGYSKPLYNTTVLQAELLALLHGLQLATAKRLLPLTVESDSQINHIYREGNTVADALALYGKKLCLS